MKKALSIILVLAMLFSFMPCAFATESENAGEYNSLKLPVRNEVREEGTAEKEQEMPMMFSSRPMTLSEQATDNTTPSAGGGGGGGGSATVVPTPDVPEETSSVFTVTDIPEQTASKGGDLVVRNVIDLLSSNVAEEVIYFYENYWEYSAVIEYEKDNNTSLMYYNECVFRNYTDDAEELIIPVPVELETGTYNVRVHQLNGIWNYRDGEYSELVFEFNLTVTDADETNEYPYSLNEIKALEDTSFSMVEGDFGDRPAFSLKEALPGEAKMVGFALCDNGNVFPISGYCDGRVIECNDEFNVLPAGKYDCYFYISSPSYDYDYDNYPDELYGPIRLNISGLAFDNEYYHTSSREQWTSIEMGASVAEKIPYEVQYETCTLSMEFKDANDNTVHSMNGVAIDDFWIDGWEDEVYGGRMYCYLNLVGFEVGSYYVDITLNDESGNSYELGEAVLNVTDKTIIDRIYILNYSGRLTTSTESFYVCVNTSNIFLDYDKININLLDANGNIVAETVSKEMQDVSTYNGSELLYKLNVTGTLEETSWDSEYTLDIQSAQDVELISAVDSVYISVTADARVVRAELTGTNTVKIYTENVLPGEYLVTDDYRLSDAETIYNVIIDEQGIGTFQIEDIEETYQYFYLREVDATDDYDHIDDFEVRIKTEDENFYSRPNFIAVNSTKIENFHVRALSEIEKPSVESIEYARVTQNGEVIATMSNLDIDSWSYYYGEAGSRIYLYGDLVVESGKSFAKGDAIFEIKYDDGFIYTHSLTVTDETTGLYGSLEVDNSCYYNKNIGDYWCNQAVGSNKVSFTINGTNATSGTVSLYVSDNDEALEVFNLSDLTKTVENGCYYTYKGTFNTVISSDNVYDVVFEANANKKRFNDFTYYTGKLAEQNSNLVAYNGDCDIYLYDWINVSNVKALTFKAVVGNNTYNIPVTESYSGDNYIDFVADFSFVPAGYFTIKAYDGSAEVALTGRTMGYNFGTVNEPITSGAGWTWVGENRDTREFRLWGANLDQVDEAIVKVYKTVDFPETDDYYQMKLQYVKDITLAKPYAKNYIAVNNELLSDLATGAYVFVYVIDGVAVETENVFVKGNEPTYKASVVLNGGVGFTNKSDAELAVSATGYTKMKVALSQAELETKEYEDITATKNISFEGKNGTVTVYVQFANDDESKTEVVETSITVDTQAPELENVNIPKLELWHNTEITFVTNEMLRNAFMLVGELNAEIGEVEGRNFVFTYVGNESGMYTYKCNVYVGSQYEDISSLDAQVVVYDKAGNNTSSSIQTITIKQPKDISGTVKFGDSPVYGASVYLYDEEGSYVSYDYTDSDGKYKFDNVLDGAYTIKVYRNGYAESSVPISEEDFLQNEIVKDIVLTSVYTNNSTVTVTVKDAAQNPKNDITVQIYNWNTGTNRTDKTDADGQVTFEKIYYKEGGTSYSIYTYDNNGYSDYEYLYVNEPTETVDFTYPIKATIRGVVKHNNESLADVEILVKDKNGYSTYEYTKTNENGEFTAEVYLNDGNRAFTLTTSEGLLYSGSTTVTFEENETEKNDVVIEVSGNASVRGYVKDANGNAITDFKQVRFYNRGGYEYIADIDETGYFETPAFLDGTYTFYLSDYYYKDYTYSSCSQSVTITEEDLQKGYKEITFTPEKCRTSKFSTGSNGISASADIIAKGDYVTINVKCQNDGTRTINSVSLNAEIPEGITATTDTNTTQSENIVSKNAGTMKADDTANMTFTIDTDDYDDGVISIPAYVMADGTKYSLGNLTIKIVSATISAPSTVKKGEAFKVTGEAIKGSAVEIINYNTKEVLAVTDCQGKWYSAEITLNEIGTVTLAAKVTKDDITAYSIATDVVVEENPVTVNDIIITANGKEYKKNSLYDYPVFYVIVYSEMVGPQLNAKVKFDNMPADATVKYTLTNQEVDNVQPDDEYYNGTIPRWKGSASNKLYATVTDNESGKEYEFIIADIIILIDPSGYVTDAETGEPIVDAEVRIEQYNDGTWSMWDAEPSGQQNPMYTDETGYYGWDVPEGKYRIIVSKDGYETKTVERYDSRDHGNNSEITVLPVRTDVDITLVNARTVELDETSTASVAGGKVKFVFTRPVDPATVTAENFKVLKSDGTEVEGSIVLAENNTVALFKPATAMANGDYKLSVANIEDGSNNIIPAEEIPFEKTTDASALAAPAVAYNTDGTITITFAEGKTPVNSEEIVVKNGNSVVNGTLRETANVITFIPDVAFTAGTTYKVVVSDAIRTGSNEYLAASFEQNVTVLGGSTPPGDNDNDGPRGGGGGGGSSISKPSASVPEGIVERGTKVELTTGSKNGKIYYTLDGSEPTKNSTLYTEAIVINESTCIKAIVINGTMESSVLTLNYNVKGADKTKFADVANYAWAQEAITQLSEKGIIKGVSETEFAPANNIKRADYMLLLVRMLGLDADVTENFADVSKDSYYYEALGVAKKLGLTTGVGNNKFNPEASITRQDMFVLAYRILEMQNVEMADADEAAISAFGDYEGISDYAKDALSVLVKNELVKGSDNKINPVGNATRAETAVFIYRLYNLLNK